MKNLLYALSLMMIFSSCDQAPDFITSKSGKYEFTVVRDAEGESVKNEEIIILELIGKDQNDSIWFDNNPMVVKKDTAAWNKGEQGFFEILENVSAGDSLFLKIPTELFFKESVGIDVPPEAASVTEYSFSVSILAVEDYEGYLKYMEELTETRTKEQMGDEYVSPEDQLAIDEELIQQYLTDNGLEAEKTGDGIYIVKTAEGEGDHAQPGQTVVANYTGYLLNKVTFDTSIKEVAEENEILSPGRPYEPFSFTIDQDQVIQGWHLGFKELSKGSKATLLIPSTLGYGRNRMGNMIPPNSVLLFDVELLEIQ